MRGVLTREQLAMTLESLLPPSESSLMDRPYLEDLDSSGQPSLSTLERSSRLPLRSRLETVSWIPTTTIMPSRADLVTVTVSHADELLKKL